jgi:hypothetical protein
MRHGGTARGAAALLRIQLAQALRTQHCLARGAGGNGGVQMCAACRAGNQEREGDAVTGRPRLARQGRSAIRAGIRCVENESPAPRAATGEKGIAGRTEGCRRQKLLATDRAGKVEVQRTPRATVGVLVHGRAASRADCLPALGAESVLYVEGEIAGRAAAGERMLVLPRAARFLALGLVLVKTGVTVGTDHCFGRDFSVTLATVKAIGCATLRA